MPPRRSVVRDAELSEDARGEPVRIPLTGHGELDDPASDKLGFLISRTGETLKHCARGIERLAHGFQVLGLESESVDSGSWHRGAARVGVGRELKLRWCRPNTTKKGALPDVRCMAGALWARDEGGTDNAFILRFRRKGSPESSRRSSNGNFKFATKYRAF
jgi:hypothetical protein